MRLAVISSVINIISLITTLSCSNVLFGQDTHQSTQPTSTSLSKSLIYSFSHASFITPEQMLNDLNQARMVIIGEGHDQISHHKNQEEIMQSLAQSKTVSVGLEFVNWNQQELFDQYQSSQIDEATFLTQVKWSNEYPFSFYKPLVDVAILSGGHAYGLNMPRGAVRKVLCEGKDKVSSEIKALMPPNFTVGSQLAFQFFKETIDEFHPLPPDFYAQFFVAQSLWDDTMAYNAIRHSDQGENHTFVVIIGTLHTYYKLGLPDRILKRSDNKLNPIVIAQVLLEKLTKEEAEPYVKKDDQYGNLADYIIFTPEIDSPEEKEEPNTVPLDFSILCLKNKKK